MARKPIPTLGPRQPPTLAPLARDEAAERFILGKSPAPDGSNHPEMVPAIPNPPNPSAPRAAKGTKKLMRRAGGRTVRRLQVYLDPETAEALEQHCDTEGREISRVVDGAIRDYLTRKGAW